jgi:protein-tyrosine phosphatase
MPGPAFTDVHCHIIPGVDDGAADMAESLAMARLAAADGVRTIVATPHQLGGNGQNRGDDIRRRAAELQERIDAESLPMCVLPGADVRIEDGMVQKLVSGDVLTLADRRRHVLLELPHELYFPLGDLLVALRQAGMVGILSHPERNAGLMRQPQLIAELVDAGCLMQVTAGSFSGTFGPRCQQIAEWMIAQGLVHFVATDAHGSRTRRPMMHRAYERVCTLAGERAAVDLCCEFPGRVTAGEDVPSGRRRAEAPARSGWRGLFQRNKAA